MHRTPLLLACLSGCVHPPAINAPTRPVPVYEGPDHATIDIVRPGANAPRIYVYVTLPDGEPGLFQVDTGASISVLSRDTADRLGLVVQDSGGFVEGLSGRAPMTTAVLPTLSLGDITVRDVEVAVGVPGVSDRAGAMVLDGILGNNLWSRFVLDIDYPRDELTLHRPGTVRMPRRSTPLFFDGGHVLAPIDVISDSEPPIDNSVFVQVDTGAGELWLIRDTGRAYGFDGKGARERLFRLQVLELASLNDRDQKAERIAVLEAGIAADGSLTEISPDDIEPIIEQAVERVSRALAIALFRRRVGAVVPLVGSVIGGAVNVSFQGDVGEAARFAFQERRLRAGKA